MLARSAAVATLVLALFPAVLEPAAAGDTGAEIDRWLRDLGHPDPFVSRRAEAEIRKLGDQALLALTARWRAWPALGASAVDVPFLVVDAILDELAAAFLLRLESEERALELDRRELEELRRHDAALRELRELRAQSPEWEKATTGFRSKAEIYLEWRALEIRREREKTLPEEDETRRRGLERQVASLRELVPQFDAKAEAYGRLRELESTASQLESVEEAAALRRQDLETRTREAEPRVAELTARAHAVGLPAYAAAAARREFIPLDESPRDTGLEPSARRFFDELLRQGVDKLKESGDFVPPMPSEAFDRFRHALAALWVLEVERSGSERERAESLLSSHLARLLAELDHDDSRVRDRAARSLYRLGERGLRALEGRGRPFLEGLLRWRIDPRVYERVGIHFNDYGELPFAARRRKVFQYARAAGADAIPTLRAIVFDDRLEQSFLVKYAAARALASQLGDRAGILALQARHPEMVLKRPEVSRDLFLLQGLALVGSKDYSAAAKSFLKILEEFPFDFQGNYHLAFSYLLLKDYPRAIHHFEIARRILPKDQLTLYNLACAYALGGHHEKAIEALGAAVDAGFDDPEHIEKDPDLDSLRKLQGYRDVLERCRAGRSIPAP
jgi:tetratricopeptide (TPR) repeat protein